MHKYFTFQAKRGEQEKGEEMDNLMGSKNATKTPQSFPKVTFIPFFYIVFAASSIIFSFLMYTFFIIFSIVIWTDNGYSGISAADSWQS